MMIVAQLAQKAQLSKDVISAVLKSLIRNVSKQLEYLALLTVLVICQTQDQVNVIFDRHTIDRVVAFTDLEAHLIKMSTAYDVTKFMVPFLKELIITR